MQIKCDLVIKDKFITNVQKKTRKYSKPFSNTESFCPIPFAQIAHQCGEGEAILGLFWQTQRK